ncbi:MAG: hypothetical protein ACO2PP_00040 [Thermocrinis sp.]|jgi:hypothetical protein|uniref:hypothetical protein n=1 Tax=Thermocrinis sp. TaxID=2024383 RepID=UPI003C10EA4D
MRAEDLHKKLLARPEPIRKKLCQIAEKELLHGRTKLLDVQTISSKEKIYKIVVKNKHVGIVWAIIQLFPQGTKECYTWKLLDLEYDGKG